MVNSPSHGADTLLFCLSSPFKIASLGFVSSLALYRDPGAISLVILGHRQLACYAAGYLIAPSPAAGLRFTASHASSNQRPDIY
ncbi:hypothetical protein F1520_11830 [Yersinia pestis]|uniref:Uncharacterized protein n=3 Tax=Yersinia pestis TaxID=632 RepID=A0A0H2Y925_YERPA|nr:hypothetical protein YPA_2834 [Yersinia pestis Antiqua]ABG17115.1 hypothetical protein YPN_0783 [Yersinia pestis Nepal516]ABP41408.1 hypothetical protein YPDSF_3050 [Yersinia pestis Pestoides F]ADW00077.1 hypothetical protein YPC_3626 [Yersinia pestis biovar Medievalis str. Harbin 35]AXY31955.1 hypothetical protein CEQ20_00125 [Yersinia pseudotuberculosis]AYW84896.1 hypothetical protein EGX42_19355 [Yersinia pestis]EEO79066.1 hypothetical protein YPF_3987 [Yersinia pestis biovar Orientalis